MELKKIFPISMRKEVECICDTDLEEIRIRANLPTEFWYSGGVVKRYSKISQTEIEEMLNYMSGYSLYALEEELCQGYFTMSGGHRVGITGRTSRKTVGGKGGVNGIFDISGMNIRIAHEKKGCSKQLIPYIRNGDSIYNTLFLAPPGIGKTTFLRDSIRLLSTGDENHPGMKVAVVDERSEIAACYRGVPQNDLGLRVDVLDNCPKVQGMQMLLRTMSPQIIAVDELGGEKEFEAVFQILHSGSKLLGTLHAENMEELMAKPYMKKLFLQKVIGRYIVLEKNREGKRVFRIYDCEHKQIC